MFRLIFLLYLCLIQLALPQRIGLEVELIYQHHDQEAHRFEAAFDYTQRRALELDPNLEIKPNVEFHYKSFSIAAKNEDQSSAYINFKWDQEKAQFVPSIDLYLPKGEVVRGVEDDFQKLSVYIEKQLNSNDTLLKLIKDKNPQEAVWKKVTEILNNYPYKGVNEEKICKIIHKKNKSYQSLSYGFDQFNEPTNATPTISIKANNRSFTNLTFIHETTIEKPDDTYQVAEVVFDPIDDDYDNKFSFISNLMESKNSSNQSIFEPHPTAGVHFHLEVINPKLLQRILKKTNDDGSDIEHKHVNTPEYTQDLKDLRKEFIKFKSVLQKLLVKDEKGVSLHQLMVLHYSNEFRQEGVPEEGIKGRAKIMQDRTFINAIEAIDEIIEELDKGPSNLSKKHRLHHFFNSKLSFILPDKLNYYCVANRIMKPGQLKEHVGFGTLEFRSADSHIIQDKEIMQAHFNLLKKIGDPSYDLTQNDLTEFVSFSLHQKEVNQTTALARKILECTRKY